MADERLIYRSLGVPDVIGDAFKLEAAAGRLAEAAGLDVTADPNASYQSQVRLEDATSVITRCCELLAAGELDGFIAGFGYRDDDWYTTHVVRRMDIHVYEQGQACARALLERVRSYVTSHPFEDDVGHPFS
jgi:hypothetical protein